MLHGPSSASPAAQAVLRNEFGIYEHPLPNDPSERLRVQSLARIYKARTGRNLLQQRDPRQAMIDLLRGQHERRGPRDIATGDRTFIGEQDQPIVPERGMPSRGGERERISLTPRGGIGLQAGVNQDWVPGGNLPRLRMPGVFGGARGGNQFGGGKTLTADEIATPTPTHFQEAAENIQRLGGLKPRLTIPTSLFDDFGVMDAYASGQGVSDEEKAKIKQQFGDFGFFNEEQRRQMVEQAKANGWTEHDVQNLPDMDLIDRSFSVPKASPWKRLLTNAGKNAAQFGATPLAIPAAWNAAKQSVEQGSLVPAAEFVQKGFIDPVIDVATDPVGSFLEDPLFTATTVSGFGRAFGGIPRLSRLARGEYEPLLPAGRRSVRLPESFDHSQTGEPLVVDAGAASQNALVAPLQVLQDRLRGRSERYAGRLVGQIASKGAAQAEHLGRQAAADRTAPLMGAFREPGRAARVRQILTGRGLSERERQAVEYFAIQDRDPDATIARFKAKLEKAPDTPNGRKSKRYFAAQIQQAATAKEALAKLDPELVERVRAAARQVESENQADLVALGMNPETLENRLWDVTERENPGRRESGAEAPSMYMPHTEAQIGGGKLRRGRPFVAGEGGARDILGGRLEERKMSTYEAGKLLQDPRAFEAAAGAPARAMRTSQELERRVGGSVAHKLDLDDEQARNFDYDDNDMVIVQAGDTRFGATRRDPSMTEGRMEQMRDLMERTDQGDTKAAQELFRRSFRVVERDPDTGRPVMGPGTYYAVPRAAWDALEDRATAVARRGGGLGKITTGWKQITLNTLPRTVVNNTVGSIPMALAGGAGALSYGRAARNLARGGADLIPGELRGVGMSGAGTHRITLGDHLPGRTVAAWMNGLRRGNVLGEDAARAAVYMKGAHKAANKAAGRKWGAGVRSLSEDARRVAEQWAKDPASRTPEVEAFIEKAVKFTGDMTGGKHDSLISLAVPFHKWYRHIVRLTLLTMPVEYPGRAIFLQELGQIGDEYRVKHGVFPGWMNDLIPLRDSIDSVPGYDAAGAAAALPQRVVGGFRTSSLNPFDTVGQVAGLNEGLGSVSPLLMTPAELAAGRHLSGPRIFQPFTDPQGNEIGSPLGDPSGWLRVAGNRFVGSVPLAKWATGFFGTASGMADTSIPVLDEQRRIRTQDGKRIPGSLYPPDSSPGGVIPTLLRGVGISIGQTDSSGARYGRTVRRHYEAQRAEWLKRRRQEAQDRAYGR